MNHYLHVQLMNQMQVIYLKINVGRFCVMYNNSNHVIFISNILVFTLFTKI